MTGSRWSDPMDRHFWEAAIARANEAEAIRSVSAHLIDTNVKLVSGDASRFLALDRGTIALGEADARADVTLEAKPVDWHRVLDGMHYYHAVNPHFGVIRMQADALVAGWTLPTLSVLFRLATLVWTDAPDASGEFR